jgi:hypothetical protein
MPALASQISAPRTTTIRAANFRYFFIPSPLVSTSITENMAGIEARGTASVVQRGLE